MSLTTPSWKPALIALGVAGGLAILTGLYVFVDQRAEILLEAHHPRPPSLVRAATTPEAIAAGRRLAAVTACAGCHGADLAGRPLSVSGSTIDATNLTVAARRLSDADLDRAIRRGLRPDATSELAMPSQAYAGFTDDEVASIIGYLRSLPPKGTLTAQPRPGLLLRANLVAGVFRPETQKLVQARPPLDAGPRLAWGRRVAGVACGQCHGTDLGGARGAPGPDLTVHGYYDRRQFHTLMRTGVAVDDVDMALMSRTAIASFSHFSDGEIDAIYDYLDARDQALVAASRSAHHGPA